jgi:hypothetical protein
MECLSSHNFFLTFSILLQIKFVVFFDLTSFLQSFHLEVGNRYVSMNKVSWMWSGASVAHTAPVPKDLGSILTQTQMALLDLPSPFFQTTDLKTISLICNIVMSS